MAKAKGQWHRDLKAMRDGRMTLEEFATVHRPLIDKQITYWSACRPRASVCEDDVRQEALLALWTSCRTWRPGTHWALSTWVKHQVRWHLQKCNRSFMRVNLRVEHYMDSVLVEDRFVLADSEDGATVAVEPQTDEMVDALHRCMTVVRQLAPGRKAEVVAHVLMGESLDSAVMQVHGPRCKAPRKAGLRAIAAAHSLMEHSSAQ